MEVRKNNLKLHNIDNRDLFNLLDIFLNNNESRVKRREQALHYAKENQVTKAVVMTVASAANCQLDYEELNTNGGKNMYSVFQETWNEGNIQGRAKEIIETGQEFGFSKSEILGRLSGVSLQTLPEMRSLPHHPAQQGVCRNSFGAGRRH